MVEVFCKHIITKLMGRLRGELSLREIFVVTDLECGSH